MIYTIMTVFDAKKPYYNRIKTLQGKYKKLHKGTVCLLKKDKCLGKNMWPCSCNS